MELGPGPGVALAAAARTVTLGQLVAVDHSATMLRQTAARNRHAIDDGRPTLINTDARHIDLELEGFDRIYAMNVWQFWPDQDWVVVDLARRLAPGGRLVLGYQPRHPGATAADADAARRCLRDQFAAAGLAVDDDTLDDVDPPAVYVIGERTPPGH
jgi:SAM-dependent methyltransferase